MGMHSVRRMHTMCTAGAVSGTYHSTVICIASMCVTTHTTLHTVANHTTTTGSANKRQVNILQINRCLQV